MVNQKELDEAARAYIDKKPIYSGECRVCLQKTKSLREYRDGVGDCCIQSVIDTAADIWQDDYHIEHITLDVDHEREQAALFDRLDNVLNNKTRNVKQRWYESKQHPALYLDFDARVFGYWRAIDDTLPKSYQQIQYKPSNNLALLRVLVDRYESRSKRFSDSAKEAAKTRAIRRDRKVYVAAERVKNSTLKPSDKCIICGKAITDDASYKRGIGSDCWQRVLDHIENECPTEAHLDQLQKDLQQ